MKPLTTLTLCLTAASAQTAQGPTPYPTGAKCCAALEATEGLHSRILYPYTTAYSNRVDSYFSVAARLSPECIFQPQDVTEVSAAVEALVTQDCKFAIRSGGHMHIPGSNNIRHGVTIDFGAMNSTTYHAENSTAAVQPGAKWGFVYEALDKEGVMVTGGRAASVGVGGLILGGGNSFYAGKQGMVCDNVAQFKVVLSNGSIVTASQNGSADLFQVLKGGGNNFGIVTRFDLMTFAGGDIWGGLMIYPEPVAPAMLPAFVKFAEATEKDDTASAIMMDSYESARGVSLFVNSYGYTAPVSRAAAFDAFFTINGSVADTTRITNMTSLTTELDQEARFRVSFSTLTFRNNLRALQKAHETFMEMVETLKGDATGEWKAFALYQPILTLLAKHSKEKGGNVLGLDRFDETLILYEPCLAWEGADQNALFHGQVEWLKRQVSKFARAMHAENEFRYLDYADANQNPLGSYGAENIEKMKAAAKK